MAKPSNSTPRATSSTKAPSQKAKPGPKSQKKVKAESQVPPASKNVAPAQSHTQLQKPQNSSTRPNPSTPSTSGSSVWPTAPNMPKNQPHTQRVQPSAQKSLPKNKSASTPQAPKAQKQAQPQRQPQPQKQTQHPPTQPTKPAAREGVSTRSTKTVTGDLHTDEAVSELTPYDNLMGRKLQQRHDGMIDESARIQAAVNVGMLLRWTEDEVIRTVERLEAYAIGGVDGARPRSGRLNGKMMEVAGEEEILGFVRAVREDGGGGEGGDGGFGRLRYLRGPFAGGGAATEFGHNEQEGGAELFAPLLLIKIQAALNMAFGCGWQEDSANGNLDGGNRERFDTYLFRQRAVHLLRAPNKQCGEEILHLLQQSKVGRKRFGDYDVQGRAIAAMPGVERRLTMREKVRLLDRVKSDLVDGREMITMVIEALACGITPKAPAAKSGLVEGSLSKRALAQLSDEGFLVLDSMYRKRCGWGALLPDYVVDGEEEEEVESGDEEGMARGRVGGWDNVGDPMEVDEEGRAEPLRVKLRVRGPG